MSFKLSDVGLTYANGCTALEKISLAAHQGEHIALVGPSGAGKTTLISLLATALAPTSGEVSILASDLNALRQSAARAQLQALRVRIGTIHQAPPLPGRQRVITAVLAGRLGQWPMWKSFASLLYPCDIAGARAQLLRVDLADKIFARCDELSGGQLQRVGIARVLYQQPELILADEPVSSLDPTLALAMICRLLAEATARGATLVTSLHAVDLALGNFPRIVGVRAGQIMFDLPTEAVTMPMLHELYANEGQNLPVQAEASTFLPNAAANDAATRAACC